MERVTWVGVLSCLVLNKVLSQPKLDDLEPLVSLLSPPGGGAPVCATTVVLGIKPKALCLLDKHHQVNDIPALVLFFLL